MSDLTREERESLGAWARNCSLTHSSESALFNIVANLLTAREQAAYERGPAEVRESILTVLVENRRATTNQMWLWDRVYAALDADPSPSADDEGVAR